MSPVSIFKEICDVCYFIFSYKTRGCSIRHIKWFNNESLKTLTQRTKFCSVFALKPHTITWKQNLRKKQATSCLWFNLFEDLLYKTFHWKQVKSVSACFTALMRPGPYRTLHVLILPWSTFRRHGLVERAGAWTNHRKHRVLSGCSKACVCPPATSLKSYRKERIIIATMFALVM